MLTHNHANSVTIGNRSGNIAYSGQLSRLVDFTLGRRYRASIRLPAGGRIIEWGHSGIRHRSSEQHARPRNPNEPPRALLFATCNTASRRDTHDDQTEGTNCWRLELTAPYQHQGHTARWHPNNVLLRTSRLPVQEARLAPGSPLGSWSERSRLPRCPWPCGRRSPTENSECEHTATIDVRVTT